MADTEFRPADYQPGLPMDRLILSEPPGEEVVPMDVLFVGGGPAGLAGAIELRKLLAAAGGELAELEVGVLEKSERLGEHCLSGAVVDPRAFRELFPDVADDDLPLRDPVPGDRVYLLTSSGQIRLPTPPTMQNHGNRVASICEIVRWLGEKAEELGVNVFTGFAADALLTEGTTVTGVRTTPAGLDRSGAPGDGYMPPTDLTARVTVLSEGTRGTLTQAFQAWSGGVPKSPPLFALGVKELWETKRPLDAVVHTLGWPLPRDVFGGSFFYPMAEDLVAIGLVAGLDYRDHAFDVHERLQRLKQHPLFREVLEGGTMVEWGAKTIPEGGYHALPERMHGDGVIVVGDAAGFVNVPALKGIHYAMHSGILAARTIFEALEAGDTSRRTLAAYDTRVRESYIHDDLYRTRNMRLAFKSGFYMGGAKAALMTVTGGGFPTVAPPREGDADEPRRIVEETGGVSPGPLSVSKVDAVFRSGNATRDDIPSHLIASDDVPRHVAEFYAHMCPAAVYEWQDGKLVVNAPNCVDCKTTDVLGPRWTPREGNAGTKYARM